jgi:opacity protein-like surface antigen
MNKTFLLLAVAALSSISSAQAAVHKVPCTTDDWGRISRAVSSPAESGENLRGEVQGMMMEEMIPLCYALVNDVVAPGIPGNTYYKYELNGGPERAYQLSIVEGGVEEPGTHLHITKL